MGATAPALRLPLCGIKSVAIPRNNREEVSVGSSCDLNDRLLSCKSSASSIKVSCGGASIATGKRAGRRVGISTELWRNRASIGLSSFFGTEVHEIQYKVRDSKTVDKGISGRPRATARLGVRMMWGGKVEAEKPSYVPLEQINGEDEFNKVLDEAKERDEPIIVDWLAAWCRKCIYLKPKLEKLAAEYHPNLKFYSVDVNAVPQALVKRANVTKMPTIQLWKNGEQVGEVIGGHQAWLVLDEVREMIQLKK